MGADGKSRVIRGIFVNRQALPSYFTLKSPIDGFLHRREL